MAKVVNDTTSGIISANTIINLITEVNKIQEWLNQLGYEMPDEGMLYTQFRARGGLPKNDSKDVLGADDFKVFAGRFPALLKKTKTDHPEVTIDVPSTHNWFSITATAQSSDQPVFVTLKQFAVKGQATFDLRTTVAPSADKQIWIHVIAVAKDNSADGN